MKRTRRSWNSTLPPSKGPTRKTKLRVKGKSRFPKERQADYTKWIRTLSCTVALHHPRDLEEWMRDHCRGEIEPAHVNKTRAKGAPDLDEVAPLCHHHHLEQEGRTAKFNKKYGVDLSQIAKDLGRRWREQQGETAA